MKLSNLKPALGSNKKSKRIARGTGSGHGGTSTRGHKGAKSRSGFKSKRAHEGGQMPLQMRLPKGGFKNTHQRYKSTRPDSFVTFNFEQLNAISVKYNVNHISTSVLYNLGIIQKNDMIKILSKGTLNQGITLSASRFSESAKNYLKSNSFKFFLELNVALIQGISRISGINAIDVKVLAQYFDFISEDDSIHVTDLGSISSQFSIEASFIDQSVMDKLNHVGSSYKLV